jgi:hypothetical protein
MALSETFFSPKNLKQVLRDYYLSGKGKPRMGHYYDGRLLLIILAGATLLRLYYINQPFVDAVGWRQADDATIADNFFRGSS